MEGAIERLTELGFLDDEAFARAWLESRDRARPRGERALKFELRRKGVAQGVVEAALDERREAAAAADGDGDGVSADEARRRTPPCAARAARWTGCQTSARAANGRMRCSRGTASIRMWRARVAGRVGQASDDGSPEMTSDD